MTLYTTDALHTAIKKTNEMIVKLANTKPTDEFTLYDITECMFYLRDYNDECKQLLRKREKK